MRLGIRWAACLLLLISCAQQSVLDSTQTGTLKLDGNALSSWRGDTTVWRVEDNLIIGSTLKQEIPHAIWLISETEHSDFNLSMWVKLTGDVNKNSGVYYRGQWDDDVVLGYEFDIGGWGTEDGSALEDNWWGELHDPYGRGDDLWVGPGRAVIDSVSLEAQWNHVQIRADGDHIQHWLNGHPMVDWYETDPDIQTRGFIGFQLHDESHCEVKIRDLQFLPLNE